MFRRKKDDFDYGYSSGNDPWDNDDINGGSSWPKVLLGLVLLVGLAAAAYFLFADRVFDSPERAARQWGEAFIKGESDRLLDLTCAGRLDIANIRSSPGSIFALLGGAVGLGGIDLGGLLPMDKIESLLDDVEIDLSRLNFSAPNDATGQAIVNVSGQMRIKLIGNTWFGLPYSDRWSMVEEGGNWRWCGSELLQSP